MQVKLTDQPNAYDFSIRTPVTPARWAVYDLVSLCSQRREHDSLVTGCFQSRQHGHLMSLCAHSG